MTLNPSRGLSRRQALLISALAGAAPRAAFANNTNPGPLPAAAAAAGLPSSAHSWFKVEPDVLKSWTLVEIPENPLHMRIVPRTTRATSRMKVMALYPRPSSAYDVAISKILQVFDDKGLHVEMKAANFRNEDSRAEESLRYAEKNNFDLIFGMGSESTAWLWKNYQGGRLPVVSVCSKDPVLLGQAKSYDSGSGTNFAFTSLNMPLESQMAYVHKLRPGLKNIAILVDANNISAVQTQAEPVAEYCTPRGIRPIMLSVKEPARAKEELERLVRDGVQMMQRNDQNLENSIFWITGSTIVFKEIRTINQNAYRVPVLSAAPEVVQEGDDSAVLSIGISFETNAHLATVYAADVLTKKAKVGELKVGLVSPPDIAINFRKAREIGLKVPFSFFESASTVVDYEGRMVRDNGVAVVLAK